MPSRTAGQRCPISSKAPWTTGSGTSLYSASRVDDRDRVGHSPQ